MTNPLVGHVLGSHGHMLLSHVVAWEHIGHMSVSQGYVLEDSLWLLVIDQALSQAQKGIW